MTPLLVGGGLGLSAGAGLVLAASHTARRRADALDDRLAPYLRDRIRPSRLLTTRALPLMRVTGRRRGGSVADGALRPALDVLAARAGRLLGGSDSVRGRLERAGRAPDVDRFRAEQIVWSAVGLLLGGALAAGLWWHGAGSVLPLVVLVLLGGAGGLVMRDWMLSREAVRREHQMLLEFPTVAELLALSVGAGEGPVAALERVTRLSSGWLSDELARTLADARAGAGLVQSLSALSARTGLAPLARFVDGIVVAVERGTPLADVLKAQAQDVREAGRRALMETAGRREIAMMVPVVFLILPITVLFAVFPGFAFMRLDL